MDPSLLFTERALVWLEQDDSAAGSIAISAAFMASLRRDSAANHVLPSSIRTSAIRRERLIRALDNVQTFSSDGVELAPQADSVKRVLRERDRRMGAIWADEWAFLQSQSWMAATKRQVLDAFRNSGAAVVEYSRRLRDALIAGVVPTNHLPPIVTRRFLTKVGVKWLVVGSPGALAPVVAGPIAPAMGFAPALLVPIVQAFDS